MKKLLKAVVESLSYLPDQAPFFLKLTQVVQTTAFISSFIVPLGLYTAFRQMILIYISFPVLVIIGLVALRLGQQEEAKYYVQLKNDRT